MQTKTQAEKNVQNHLKKFDNEGLAKVLEKALNPRESEENQTLAGIFRFIVAEAEARVGHLAREVEAAEDKVFREKFGIHEGMTEAELDAIFDKIPASELPRGTAPILVEVLRR